MKKIFLLYFILVVFGIKVNAQCNADFRAEPDPTCVNSAVYFINISEYSGSTNFFWDFGPGATPATWNGPTPPPVFYSTPGPKNVDLILTGSCNDIRQRTIDIAPEPVVTFSTTAPECTGTGVDFNYTGDQMMTYEWVFGEGAIPYSSTLQNPQGVIFNTAGTKTVYLTVSNGFCNITRTTDIVINQTPDAGFTSTAPQCTGLDVDFSNTGTTGLSYQWDFGASSSPSTSTNENPTGISYSTSGSKVISLITTNGSTGCSATSTGTININPTPTVSFTSTAPVCVGDPVNFINTGTTGQEWSYSWDFGDNSSPTVSSTEHPSNVIYETGGQKTVTFVIYNGLCVNTAVNTIDINPLPTVYAGEDTTICADRSIQLGEFPQNDMSYSWFPSNTLDTSNIANPTASPIAPMTNYILTATNNITLCQNSDSVLITMLSPLIADAGNDMEICFGDEIQIGAALIEGQEYNWSPEFNIEDITVPNPFVNPDTTVTYLLSVTGGRCDPVFDEVKVLVHPLPDANAGLDTTITTGSEVQLIATGGIQYFWTPEYDLNNSAIFNPIASPIETTEFIVSVTDIYGCIKSDSVIVSVIEPSYWVPNAFTPDNNGSNDIFYVRGNGFEDFELFIFNRNGKIIYYSNNTEEGWNGKNKTTGEIMPKGAYLFKIRGKDSTGNNIDQTGIINLIR